MQTDSASFRSSTVRRRFWLLLGLIMLLAIASSAVVQRIVALPFLQGFQEDAVKSQASKTAAQLEARLSLHSQWLSFIVNDPDVVNIVLGYVDTSDYFTDLVQSLPRHQDLSWLELRDAFAETLGNYSAREEEARFFSANELDLFASGIIDGEIPYDSSLLHNENGMTYLVTAMPIYNEGFCEGVLLAGYLLNQAELFPSNSLIQDTMLILTSEETELTKIPLKNGNLSVALLANPNSVSETGNALISQSVTAIGFVLVFAFGCFALLGNKVIVKPHERLAIQKKELGELAAIAQRANDAVILTDLSGAIRWVNPAFEALSGYQLNEIVGRSPGSFLQGKGTDPNTVDKISRALKEGAGLQTEILNYSRTGGPYWISLKITPLINDAHEHYGFVAISNDVSRDRAQRQALEAAHRDIEHQALHDALTGLPNRRCLDEAFDHRRKTEQTENVLIRIDLDHFKYVNDNLGHDAGDFVLREVAKILLDVGRPEDLVARVGGDEFVILMGHDATLESGEAAAYRMLKRIQTPMQFEGKSIRVGASFGVASTNDGLLTLDNLIVGADAALYLAKDSGRNTVCLYTEDLHHSVIQRRDMAVELRKAIEREEFEPYFQPQFDATTLEVTGVETLARWHSKRFGLVMPGDFFPVAEQLSVVEEIDDIIFRKAIERVQELQGQGITIPKLSVNVTAQRVQDLAFMEIIRNLPPGSPKIAFEILESVLVEEQSDHFRFSLDTIREAGVFIEVDDFGSGHASVVGLLKLQPDAMKIDQRLVRPIADSDVALGVLKSIVAMAKVMGLHIIAEGVETEEHVRILRQVGCSTLQGYVFSRPLQAEDLKTLLRNREAKNVTMLSDPSDGRNRMTGS